MKNKEIKCKRVHGLYGGNLESRGQLRLCFDGVLAAFPGLPEEVENVTFVLSVRPHPEAAKITYSMSESEYEWLTRDDCMMEQDYVLHMDDEDYYLMAIADKKMRKLWTQGYNYIRAEYSA